MGSPRESQSLLVCGHVVFLTPAPQEMDTVYCRRCGDYREVQIVSVEWRIKCRGCRLGRKYGDAESTARIAARRHYVKHCHVVELRQGPMLVELVGPAISELPLSLDLKQHQGGLRQLLERHSDSKHAA